MSADVRATTTTAFIPAYEVARLARAEMRVMYFAHGRSATLNYGLLRSTFPGGSEARSIDAERGLVTLNECADIDHTTDITDDMVPMYTARVNRDIAQAVQHIFNVQRRVPSWTNTVSKAHFYVVCCCATWAYTTNMLTAKDMRDRPIEWTKLVGDFVPPSSGTEENNDDDDDDDDDDEQGAIHGEDAVPSATAPAFSLARFLHEFVRLNWHECRYVKITRTVAAERVVRALTHEPETTFARIVRSSVTKPSIVDDDDDDDDDTQRRFADNIRRAASHFDVFPNALLTTRADSHSWVLVKHTHRSQVTVTQARDMMHRARQTRKATLNRKAGRRGKARQERKRRRTILSTSNDSALCSTGAEEEEEEESAAVSSSGDSPIASSHEEDLVQRDDDNTVPEMEPVAGTCKMTTPPPEPPKSVSSTADTNDEPDDPDSDYVLPTTDMAKSDATKPLHKITAKPRIIRSIRFSVKHESLLRHAILVSNATTFKIWSFFKKENMNLQGVPDLPTNRLMVNS